MIQKENKIEKMIPIAKAAVKLFNEKGYLKTTMNDITKAARFSKGGIYHYFSSKDKILYFVLNNYMDQAIKKLEELNKIIDPDFRIRLFIKLHTGIYVNNINEAKTLHYEAYCLPPKYFKIIKEKQKKYYQIIFDIVAESLGKEFQKHQLTAITFTLLGMCSWIYSWYNPEGTINPKDLAEIISSIFAKGRKGLSPKIGRSY